MSGHYNSAYNGESLFRLPARTLNDARYSKGASNLRTPVKAAVRISRPPDQIWGKYNNYRANGEALSAVIHIAVVGLLLSGVFVTHQITQRETRQVVTLIAPSPDTYALPISKKII